MKNYLIESHKLIIKSAQKYNKIMLLLLFLLLTIISVCKELFQMNRKKTHFQVQLDTK